MSPVLIIILHLLALTYHGDGARILALVPFPARSHWIVMEPLFQDLANRGHDVTVFTAFPQKKPLANYTDVDFSDRLTPMISAFSIDMIREKMPNPITTNYFMREVHEVTCKVLGEPEFQKLIKSNEKYDLVITELFATECYSYFAHKFKAPLIRFTTSMALPWASETFGLPDNPAYIPNYLVTYPPNMNLWQKMYNTFVLVYSKYLHLSVFPSTTQKITEQHFGESLPPVDEIISNSSLLFVNSYHVLAQSRPFPPNVIEVGGIHIKKRQPLPEDFKNILDRSKKGAIIMSFGSLVRSSTIPKSIIMMFINAFAKIPQTVIFKYEEDLPDVPPNVILKKWLPQRDMMEHENVVAIIAHGGLASTIESVYFGKPIIGVPFFADQYANIQSVVRQGAGFQLDLDTLTEEKVSEALKEVTGNPKYMENMKQLSQRFKDRPMLPLDTAVFWTEYVIRHKGASHLRPASVDLPFYEYLLLDVVAVILLSVLILVYIVFHFIKRMIFRTDSQTCKTSFESKKNK